VSEGDDRPAGGEMPEWGYAPPPTAYDLVRDHPLVRAARTALHVFLRLCLRTYHRLQCRGAEHVLDNLPCVIAPNHTSNLDNIAVFAALPLRHCNRIWSVAARDYFFDNRLLALITQLYANGIPLDRTGANRRGLRMCARKLREGGSIIIFPEGRRTRTGEVGPFKPGAVALCRGLKVPVIPTYLKGTFESLPPSRFLPRRRPITVTFGEPVRFWEGDLAELDHQNAARHLEDRVRELQSRTETPC
jgi:1-acyl-sn-glycerol-3-phosphate acyltransferase